MMVREPAMLVKDDTKMMVSTTFRVRGLYDGGKLIRGKPYP